VTDNAVPPVGRWITGPLADRLTRQVDRIATLPDVVRVAVMPDVHEGLKVPNGVVVATRRLIFPDLVGADIGCGLAALRFDAQASAMSESHLRDMLAALAAVVPTLKQPAARADQLAPRVEALGELSCDRLAHVATRDGRYQLGTLGRGNHFFELARDDVGDLWAVVHTGSRAMGQEITTHHVTAAQASAGELPCFDLDSPAGAAYFRDMEWACRYAAANRMTILNAAADILEVDHGIQVDEAAFIDSPHNFARLETHCGERLLVHRKSANAAPAGAQGLIAGSMAAGSRIVVGLGDPQSLCSSSHGAGRAMSRTEASQRIATGDLKGMMRGVVYRDRWAARFRDEAPQAYKDFHAVMQAQRSCVRTERTLLPVLNDKRPG